MAAQVLDLELSDLPDSRSVLPHRAAFVVVRAHGHPVGTMRIACPDGSLTRDQILAGVEVDRALARRAAHWVALASLVPVVTPPPRHTWTVAVCTRDRPELLRRCLKSIHELDPAPTQVVVVDNAPSSDEAAWVAQEFDVDYVVEPVPGLNRARRRAMNTARGEIVLFTDDDVVVDRYWARSLVEAFEAPRVAAVTGLTMPLELENDTQETFERRGGFGRGFERRVVDLTNFAPIRAGSLGAGANMAFRRSLAVGLGVFDAELDRGTRAHTGGDNYAFYLLLRAGHQLVYTPDALAWHRHRSDHAALLDTLAGYSTGAYTWMLRALLEHRDRSALRAGVSWFRRHHVRRLVASLLRRQHSAPLDVSLAEVRGVVAAPMAYLRTRGDRS